MVADDVDGPEANKVRELIEYDNHGRYNVGAYVRLEHIILVAIAHFLTVV